MKKFQHVCMVMVRFDSDNEILLPCEVREATMDKTLLEDDKTFNLSVIPYTLPGDEDV